MRFVAIGGSAGAIEALHALFGALGTAIRASVGVVIHMPATTPSLLPQVLADYTPLVVREALDKTALEPGVVFVAPPDYHLLIERGGTVALSRDRAHMFSRPAIDPFFESVAHAFGRLAIGVLLTGANEDGADGLAAIARAGGKVCVQDPATAVAAAMPSAGLARCTPDLVASPAAIGAWVAQEVGAR